MKIILVLFTTVLPSVFGMFEAILSQFDCAVKNSPILNFDEMKVTRFNRTTFVLNGNFKVSVDSTDGFDALCTSFRKMGNVYKLIPYKVGPTSICDMLKEDKYFYPDIHAHSENFPPLGTCDFKSGTFYIKNYLPKLDMLPPVLQSGDYKLECVVTKGGEIIQAIHIYGQLFNIPDEKPNFG